MKFNRWFQIFALVVLASMILAACAPQATPTSAPPTTEPTTAAQPTAVPPTEAPATEVPATEEPAAPTKNTVIIGVTDKLASLDPADAYAIMDWESIKNISEGLLRWKPGTLDLEPALATDLGKISEDGLVYTYTLKPDIKFADGTPLDATIYAAQLNRLLTIGPGATCPNGVAGALVTPYVESITAPDAQTIVFTLKNKLGYFVQLLTTAPYVVSDPKTFPADTCVLFPEAPIYCVGPCISPSSPKMNRSSLNQTRITPVI
jgi:peptide/nickel transport system substrate-binding protein